MEKKRVCGDGKGQARHGGGDMGQISSFIKQDGLELPDDRSSDKGQCHGGKYVLGGVAAKIHPGESDAKEGSRIQKLRPEPSGTKRQREEQACCSLGMPAWE